MTLIDWVRENCLNLQIVQHKLASIEEVGLFLILDGGEEDIIIDKNFFFHLTEEEMKMLNKHKPNYFLFEFGERWYYSEIKAVNTKEQGYAFLPSFKQFKFLGNCTNSQEVDFPHLGVHTEYELLNGSGSVENWVQKAKFYGIKTLGMCDTNTLGGTLAFQLACEKKGLKSIIGETVTVAYDIFEEQVVTHEVKLYVKNEAGWRNLLRINKFINVDNAEFQFIIEDDLFSLSEGLILVFGKESLLFRNMKEKVFRESINKYKKYFDCYFQIDSVTFSSETQDKKHLDAVSFYLNNFVNELPGVLINDAYYIEKEHADLKYYLNSVSKIVYPESRDQYLKTAEETLELLFPLFDEEKLYCGKNISDLIDSFFINTKKIEQECDFKIQTGERKLPKYEFFENKQEKFFELLYKGFEERVVQKGLDIEVYSQRLETEMEVILKGDLIDYFLILWDIIDWCRKQNIYVGTGRGSVCGSLVAYLIDITTIDPLKFNLLFERFLNVSRIESKSDIPDVDLDFEAEGRDRVKKYIIERFGNLQVCYIGTYNRIKMKGAMKDFGRVKGLVHKYVNFVSTMIPNQLEYEWGDLFKHACRKQPVREFVQKNYDICNLMYYCLDQARTKSIHASAVIITPKKNEKEEEMTVFDWLPVRMENGVLVSEWEGKYTDASGFLKEDILGLNQLDKFKMMIQLIMARNGNKKIVLEDLPLDDKQTYKLFQKGYNEDVFQFTSPGLKSYSAKVKPDNIEDLIAMSALYRPGPMSSNAHIDFADFKHGKKKPEYDYGLKEITKNTQSLMIYQEQVMQAFVSLGGFTLAESNDVRTYIKKFDKVKMALFEEKFINGAISNGCPKDEAPKIWKKILAFSGYGFNKCITLDSVIKTKKGDLTLKEIIELKERGRKLTLISFDEERKRFFYQKLKCIHFNGERRVFKIILEDGNILKSTLNHKWLTATGYKTVENLNRFDEFIMFDNFSTYSTVLIKDIELGEIEQVFDIEMPNTHNYVTNGIVSHNSHSAAYSVMSYWTQYLKAHYPLEFWTTALHYAGDDEVASRISEMNRVNPEIALNPPDINKSWALFYREKESNSIYWSLSKIKNLGPAAIRHIISVRQSVGDFTSIEEFVNSVQKRKINKAKVQCLILSGCFDKIYNLQRKSERLYLLQFYAQQINEEVPEEFSDKKASQELFWIEKEKALTGFGQIDYRVVLRRLGVDRLSMTKYVDYDTMQDRSSLKREVLVAGALVKLLERQSKKGVFGILGLEHNNNIINVLLWNDVYTKYRTQLSKLKNKVIGINGEVNFDTYSNNNSLYSNYKTKLYFDESDIDK